MNRKNCIYFIDIDIRDVIIDIDDIVSLTKTRTEFVLWTVGLKNGQIFETEEDLIKLIKDADKNKPR